MFKWLWLSAFAFCFIAVAIAAHADTVRFYCNSEESANMVGAAVVEGQDEAMELARPLLMVGECTYLSEKMFVYVVHRGATFGTTSKVTVVGLSRKLGEWPDMWGFLPTDELRGDGTI